MIVRAGGLTLRAPDTMPAAARSHVEALRALAAESLVVSGDTDMAAAAPHIAAVEIAAFGRRHASRLRRCGAQARLSASGQLLKGWGQAVTTWRGVPTCH
ncbi:hypothetical protein [Blastococcus saxobsidens]|uniref:Uncharacterized protein n=1 Tax=Blastococcus saxobsidens TaxID=138336 RepID=A0A4Q7Y1V3_9ACTN|nr:hypothetical protein [Blastococcus saxobsidens]RZU30478.1 hypothetical protein BKA19_0094 [Blastococcus saxobsidens]